MDNPLIMLLVGLALGTYAAEPIRTVVPILDPNRKPTPLTSAKGGVVVV